LKIHKYTLRLHKSPWRDLRLSDVVPGTWGRRGSPDSDETDGGAGRGRVGMGPTFTYSSILRFGWVGTKAGEGSAAPGLGGRGEPCSGEEHGGTRQQMSGKVPTRPMGATTGVGRVWE
jgi:hypothetical protein